MVSYALLLSWHLENKLFYSVSVGNFSKCLFKVFFSWGKKLKATRRSLFMVMFFFFLIAFCLLWDCASIFCGYVLGSFANVQVQVQISTLLIYCLCFRSVIRNPGRKLPSSGVLLESGIPLFLMICTRWFDQQAHLSELRFYIWTIKTCICSTLIYIFILFQELIDIS